MNHYKFDADLSDYFNKTDRIIKREELIHYIGREFNEDKRILSSKVSSWLGEKRKKLELKYLGRGLYKRNVEIIPIKLFKLQEIVGLSSKKTQS